MAIFSTFWTTDKRRVLQPFSPHLINSHPLFSHYHPSSPLLSNQLTNQPTNQPPFSSPISRPYPSRYAAQISSHSAVSGCPFGGATTAPWRRTFSHAVSIWPIGCWEHYWRCGIGAKSGEDCWGWCWEVRGDGKGTVSTRIVRCGCWCCCFCCGWLIWD